MAKLLGKTKILISGFWRNCKGDARLKLIAWLLFLVCGIIYLVAAIRDRDLLMVTGSICFVLAVIFFLLPGKLEK